MILWVKALHVVAMVAWMAGLFYLPRLFVYHVGQAVGSEIDVLFKVMERRLLLAIMRPAAIATILAGIALVVLNGFAWTDIWLLAKLLGVFCLVGFHFLLEYYRKLFAVGWRGRS